MVGLKQVNSKKRSAATVKDLPTPDDGYQRTNDNEAEFLRLFDEEVSPPLHPVLAPFPFERIHPRLRDWLASKQHWLAIVLVTGLAILAALELFTNIDLGLVPNGPNQEEPAP